MDAAVASIRHGLAYGESLAGDHKVLRAMGVIHSHAYPYDQNILDFATPSTEYEGSVRINNTLFKTEMITLEEVVGGLQAHRWVSLVCTYSVLKAKMFKSTDQHVIIDMVSRELVRRTLDRLMGVDQPIGYTNL